MSRISTHVLDLARGRPAAGIPVALHRLRGGEWVSIASLQTDADGRGRFEQGFESFESATYRLVFQIEEYSVLGLYPEIIVTFRLGDPIQSYHLPLLLSPNGYTTYRGS